MALFMVKTWMGNKVYPIYGAEWAGGSDPSWTRTDDAVGFSAPNPYYSGMSTTPSSPFDNIMPWSGMRRVTDASAGELVEIPKFYYKWTRNVSKMKLQISMTKFDGFLTSPAHADRGDGVGERDYVYVGRYHCASDYKSKTGVKPKTYTTRSAFRSGIHNLGSNIWQFDFALWWTINMLYLVEFANWNSQTCIGYGGGTSGAANYQNNGASDSMPYHTGTMKTSRTTWGAGIQYRHIENPWANVRTWIDGVYTSGTNVYCVKNPSNFSDNANGVLVSQRITSTGTISKWNNPNISGFEFALFPSEVNGSSTTYVTDAYAYNSTGVLLHTGGDGDNYTSFGAFYMANDNPVSFTYTSISSRLMVLPPSRLSA